MDALGADINQLEHALESFRNIVRLANPYRIVPFKIRLIHQLNNDLRLTIDRIG